MKTPPNNSMDTRAKQLLCYRSCPLNLRLSLTVSPRVISAVRHLLVKFEYDFSSKINTSRLRLCS
jgi:hypothetical protein